MNDNPYVFNDEIDEFFSVKSLQNITAFLLKKYSWDFNYYACFIEVLQETESHYFLEYVFSEFLPAHPVTTFYKTLLIETENNRSTPETSLSAYTPFSNNPDILLDGLYFLLLPQQSQQLFYSELIKRLLYRYKAQLDENSTKREKALLHSFRSLPLAKKDQAVEYVRFLSLGQKI